MAGRWGDPSAFRADPAAAPAARPTRRQAVALLAVLVLVSGAIAIASYLIRPERARAFALFHGSLFLADQQGPIAVDLASGKPTLRLVGADKQVGVTGQDQLGVVPLDTSTLLLNESTGEFNMVDSGGFVVKNNGGVPLGGTAGQNTTAMGVANGELSYVVRSNTAGTDVYLVGQATVDSAASAIGAVKPRASTTMAGFTTSGAPGSAAAANGALWLLVDSASGRTTIRRLTVPAGSSTGVALRVASQGAVPGTAAIGTATQSPGGTGTTAVGVASADRIQLFGATSKTVRFPAVPGVTQILPATSGAGRLAFLLHGSNGWSLVSVGADGSGLRAPRVISGIGRVAKLAQPAASNGDLYTIDQSDGGIFRIDADGKAAPVAGAGGYPVVKGVEAPTYSDAYVIARGSRVVINSPTHTNAVMLFTDGSHPPKTIQKSSAVAVSASNGAEQLTRSTVTGLEPGQNPKPGGTTPKPAPGQSINNKIDCKTTAQRPHIPTIDRATPGSRSVLLHWTYPILDPTQDCYPTTYVLSVKLISGNAPSPPSSVTIQGQDGANLTGLFPLTQYEITVTAYINGEGTSSAPVRIRTGPEGPAAPTNVTVSADSSGDWNLAWQACGSVQQGCVAAQSWTVTPTYCDGRGLGEPPTPLTVTADPTSKAQPPVVYKGGDALLGRGLSFTITGQGVSQVPGTPSAKTPCTYSWSNPDASVMSLAASVAPVAQLGQATTATVTLNLGSDPVRAEGGVGATVTFQLLSGGSVVKTIGPTSQTSVKFPGVQAGVQYQARATVAAPRHPSATATVGPIDVQTAHAPWPTITVTGTPASGDQGGHYVHVAVSIGNLTSAQASGERFDLTSDSGVYCGNHNQTQGWDKATAIDPGDTRTFTVDSWQMFGDCVVKVQLVQNEGSGTAVFGSGTSSNAATSSTFTIQSPDLGGVSGGDFSAAWDGSSGGNSQIAISYVGGNALIGLFATNWSVIVSAPGHADCGHYSGAGSLADVTVDQACVNDDGASGDNWHVSVAFTYIGQSKGPVDVTPVHGGAAPTYNPPQCNVAAANLSAKWAGSAANPAVEIDAGDGTKIKDCGTTWTYTIVGPTTANCGADNSAASPAQSPQVPVTCSDSPAASGWSVTGTYKDTDGTTKPFTISSIDGPPPS